MNIRSELDRIAREHILILDGAMGTIIQTYNLNEDSFRGNRFSSHSHNLIGCNDVLCLTQPELITSIHESYLNAGADIIEACSFNANAVSLADYGLADEAYGISLAAARLAKDAAVRSSTRDKPRFAAGILGPMSKSASISPDLNDPSRRGITWDELEEAYYENARGLLDGGADILLIETVFDTLNAKAAVFAINRIFDERGTSVPLMISATISDAAGRLLSGQTVEAFCVSVLHANPWALGLNCSFGPEKLLRHIADMAAFTPCLVSCHPNAGIPNQLGEYDETPESFARYAEELMAKGLVNVIGGCCGTRPEHIAALAQLAKKHRPRVPARYAGGALQPETFLSGLDLLPIDAKGGIVCIGERTNVAGSKKFLRLIKDGAYEEAIAIARDMTGRGASLIDICMDDALLDATEAMRRFLSLALSDPEIARVPVMPDSSSWDVLEAALKCVQGKCLVNSISLKEGEAEFLRKGRLIRRYGAMAVVMLFDEQGQAACYERKIAIAGRSYSLLTADGFPPEDIVFDPNILSVATGMTEHDTVALDFINACAWIRQHCPYSKISGGISNLSFSFRGNDTVRQAMHGVFLKHAMEAGLDMVIANPAGIVAYNDIEDELRDTAEDVILCRRDDAVERLLSLAMRVKEAETQGQGFSVKAGGGKSAVEKGGSAAYGEKPWRDLDAGERIVHSIVKGIDEFIEKDVLELRPSFAKTLDLVEGPLMMGMKEVGRLFGDGRMFLPQVIRSARVMKKAVTVLEPFINEERAIMKGEMARDDSWHEGKDGEGVRRTKIILATVKGDVHDIGKNIVSLVLGCNGYEVVDLGVMVPAENILEAAQREGAMLIGLSGLITPSLGEMIHCAKEMENGGLKIPLLIGGATTSLAHTALRIAPEYSSPVVYVSDAGLAAETVRSLLSANDRPRFLEGLESGYRDAIMRHEKSKAGRELLPLAEARKNRVPVDWNLPSSGPAPAPRTRGIIQLDDYSIEKTVPYINWDSLCHAWNLPTFGAEKENFLRDARLLLDRVIKEKLVRLKAAVGFFPALAYGDDIVLFEQPSGGGSGHKPLSETCRFPMLRSQEKKGLGAANPCLADFVLPKEKALPHGSDWIGLFAASADKAAYPGAAAQEGDGYGGLLLSSLADHLAEAFAEELHLRVRREFWAYNPDERLSPSDLLKESCRGIRPCFGYPACPDHEDKRELFKLLEAEKRLGLKLSETAMIIPASSVAGMYIAHPASYYFGLGDIGPDQLEDWASRKGLTRYEAQKRTGRI